MEFYKVSGGGNDLIFLPDPARTPTAEQIRAWCHRGISLGADGLSVLTPGQPGALTMVHYNADGTRAGLCLNGSRCAARLAFELGWAKDTVILQTDAGEVQAEAVPGEPDVIALTVPSPESSPERRDIEVDDIPLQGVFVIAGNPHLVLPWSQEMEEAPVETLGAALVHHPAVGEAGANIHLVRYHTPDHFEIRSYERGVNAETLACGTGVLGATAAGLYLGTARLPLAAQTRGGFTLRVDGEVDEATGTTIKAWRLIGDARLVARGELLPGAGPK